MVGAYRYSVLKLAATRLTVFIIRLPVLYIQKYQLNTSLMSLPFNTGRYAVSSTCASFKPRAALYCLITVYCISIYKLNTSLMSLPFKRGRYTVSFTCASFKPRTVLYCLIILYLYLSTQYLPHVYSLQHLCFF